MGRLLTMVAALGLLLYPFLVYLGISHGGSGWALILLGLFTLRFWPGASPKLREWLWLGRTLAGVGVALTLLTLLCRDPLWLLYYPVVVNLLLLALFAWSLGQPRSLVERLARLQDPQLPAAAIPYTRRVTQIWCGFFLLNGTLALATVLWGDMALWSLYNGLLSYLLMATLMAGEWLVRRRVQARLSRGGQLSEDSPC